MVAHACRGPQLNYNQIMTSAMSLLGINSQHAKAPANAFSGLTIDPNMIKVPVSRITPPKITYRGNSPREDKLAQGRWNVDGSQASSPCLPQKYTVVELIRPGNEPCGFMKRFVKAFEEGLEDFGLSRFGPPFRHPSGAGLHMLNVCSHKGHFSHDDMMKDQEELRKTLQAMKTKFSIRLVLILLPDSDQELYGLVKRVGDVQVGIHTMCHVPKGKNPEFEKNFLANLYMKFNLKLSSNSANQVLAQKTDKILTNRTMLLGIDVVSLTSKHSTRA